MNNMNNMNILILGKGSRENVIKEKLEIYKNNYDKIFIINDEDFINIYNFCIDNSINLVIPSTEEYLCKGIIDYLQEKIPNIYLFGPNKYQSQLEGSKYFCKNAMKDLNIPTPRYNYINMTELNNKSLSDIKLDVKNEIVLKYSGLAKGKGVFLPNNEKEFKNSLNILTDLGLNDDKVLLEERLYGTEVSVLAFCNGKEAFLMPQAQDFKRKNDNNEGYNTGGMGAISPVNILSEDEIKEINNYMTDVVKMFKYVGILYAGLIKTKNKVYFLEFNCRLGDPEAQVILNLLVLNKANTFSKIIKK